jgi:hypothetical protein
LLAVVLSLLVGAAVAFAQSPAPPDTEGTAAEAAAPMVGLFAQDHFTPNTTGNGLLHGGGVTLLLAQAAGVVAVGVFVACCGRSSASGSPPRRIRRGSTSASTA